ncbi:MAG: CotH kinase family protein, partial [Bacteroidota bacterium]
PANNMRMWRERKEGGKWRWMLFDLDATAGYAAWSQSTVSHNTMAFATATDGNWWPNGPHSTLWLRKLLENEEFRNEFIQRSSTYADLLFNTRRVNRITDSLKSMINPEVNRHLNRWTNRFWDLGGGQPMGGSRQNWEGYIQTFKDFFQGRPWQNRGHIRAKFGLGQEYQLGFNINRETPGKILLHSNEVRIPPQFRSTYFPDIPLKIKAVPDPGYIFLRWEESGDTRPELEFMGNGIGAAILTPIFVPEQPSITEIHYNPQEGAAYEFIELYNPGTVELDLEGYQFVEGIEYRFPAGISLGPDEYLLLAKDESKYAALACQVLQWDAGDLDNEGEILRLDMPNGIMADEVFYTNSSPWPSEANGGGGSLSLKKPYFENSVAENWEAYFAQGGSPCGESSPVLEGNTDQAFSVETFPNPVEKVLSIRYTLIDDKPLPFVVFDHLGREVVSSTLESSPFEKTEYLDVMNLAPGLYMLRFGDEARGIESALMVKK